MSKTLQFRRDITANLATQTGSLAELWVDTSTLTVLVMDGVTPGGNRLASEKFVTSALQTVATTTSFGTVRLDGVTLTSIANTLSVQVSNNSSTLGVVKVDGTSILVSGGLISVNTTFLTSISVTGTLVQSSPTAHRNFLHNGNFFIWQRGSVSSAVAGYSTMGTYAADRWVVNNVQYWNYSSDVPTYGFGGSIEFGNFSGATYAYTAQRIESYNANPLVNQPITVSFWAKNIAGSSTAYVELAVPSTQDYFAVTNTTIIADSAQLNITSNWQYFTATFSSSILSTSSVANGLEVRIVRQVGTNITRVTGVQLELGYNATPFENRPRGYELALCQRYYYTRTPVGPINGTTSAAVLETTFPVTLRTSGVITHPFSNSTYTSGGSPGVGTWNLQQLGVVAASATGTFNINSGFVDATRAVLWFSGMTLSTTTNYVTFNTSALITFSADL